jgi:predicted RNA-binding Zn-ribbon protein involved in translation (DUF1610 family)
MSRARNVVFLLVTQEVDNDDTKILGAFETRYAAKKEKTRLDVLRRQLVDRRASQIRASHGFDIHKAQQRAEQSIRKIYVRSIPLNQPYTDDLYVVPAEPEPIAPEAEMVPLPCPNCGQLIREYEPTMDVLTWCDYCDWNGFSLSDLQTGNKKGAGIWSFVPLTGSIFELETSQVADKTDISPGET